MKITKKQQQEIDFLTKYFCIRKPTESEIRDYIDATVHGRRKVTDKISSNILRNAKQRLDIQIGLWREDLVNGLLDKDELLEDFKDKFGQNLIKSIINSINPKYRKENMKTVTALSITNFADAELAYIYNKMI